MQNMNKKMLKIVYGDCTLGVSGDNFSYIFSYVAGGMESLVKDGIEWLFRCPKPAFGERLPIMIGAVDSKCRVERGCPLICLYIV